MPKKATITAIILALLLNSCSTLEKYTGLIGGIAAVGVTAGSFLLMKKRKEDKESVALLPAWKEQKMSFTRMNGHCSASLAIPEIS